MPTKAEIKKWMKENGKTRNWLAEQCRVSKRTVDDWFRSSREIPYAKLKLIEQLIGGDTFKVIPYDAVVAFPVRMSKEEWDLLCRASGASDLETAENFAREMLQKAVEKILFTAEHRNDLMAAEDDEYLE